MNDSIRRDIDDAIAELREHGSDPMRDHFYGAWWGPHGAFEGKHGGGKHPEGDHADAIQIGRHVYAPNLTGFHGPGGTVASATYEDSPDGSRRITSFSVEGGTPADQSTMTMGYVYGAATKGPMVSPVRSLWITKGALGSMERVTAAWMENIGHAHDLGVEFHGKSLNKLVTELGGTAPVWNEKKGGHGAGLLSVANAAAALFAESSLAGELDAAMREAGGTDDEHHFYGAWYGGRAAEGGHPGGPAGGYQHLVDEAKGGGFSVKAFGAGSPHDGFMVSPYPDREGRFPVTAFGKGDVKDFIAKNKDLLDKPGHFLGGWLDGDLIYLDVSRNVATEDLARQIGKDAHQLAAWDVKNNREVDLREVGTGKGVSRRAILHPKAADQHIDAFVAYLKGKG